MTDNLASFNRQLANFSQKLVPAQAVLLHKKVVLEALNRVVLKTPVDLGQARGEWQVTVGSPAAGKTGKTDPTGQNAILGGLTAVAGLSPYQVVWLTNNSDHIEVLENGGFIPKDPGPSKDPRSGRTGRILVKGGFSIQAPKGMVNETFRELLQIF